MRDCKVMILQLLHDDDDDYGVHRFTIISDLHNDLLNQVPLIKKASHYTMNDLTKSRAKNHFMPLEIR